MLASVGDERLPVFDGLRHVANLPGPRFPVRSRAPAGKKFSEPASYGGSVRHVVELRPFWKMKILGGFWWGSLRSTHPTELVPGP